MDEDATWHTGSLDPGDVMLDGDPALPTERGTATTHFPAHVYCGQTVGSIKMALGTEVRLGPGDIVLDGDQTPPRKGVQQPSTFRPISVVAKQSPISATAELLLQGSR